MTFICLHLPQLAIVYYPIHICISHDSQIKPIFVQLQLYKSLFFSSFSQVQASYNVTIIITIIGCKLQL